MDRVPIQTYVMEYNEEMVREAIEPGTRQRRTGILCLQPRQDIDEVAGHGRNWCRRRTLPMHTDR